MEVIATAIRSSLVSFLSEKLADVVDQETLQSYVDEWLNTGTAGKPAPKKRRSQPKKVVKETVKEVEDVEKDGEPDYEKMKVTELKTICKERGLSCVGTKATLIYKIINDIKDKAAIKEDIYYSDNEEVAEQQLDKQKRKPKKQPKSKVLVFDQPTDENTDEEQPPVQRKLKTKKQPVTLPKVIEKVKQVDIEIVTDKYGNAIHEDTGLVFNEVDEVIGHVDKDGSIMRLSNDDVDCCKRYNFNYVRESDFDEDE